MSTDLRNWAFEYQKQEADTKTSQQQVLLNEQTMEDNANKIRLAKKAEDSQNALMDALRQSDAKFNADDEDPASQMARHAEIIGQFDPVKGVELMGKVALARKHSVEARKAESEEAASAYDQIEPILAGIKDEGSFNEALMIMSSALPPTEYNANMIKSISDHGYDQGYIDHIRKGALDAKTRSQLALQQAQIQASQELAAERKARRDVLIPAQADAAKARATHLRKAGATKGKATAASDRVYAQGLIKADYEIIDEDKEQALLLAQAVIERADGLMEENPNLKRQPALREAYRIMKKTDVELFGGFDKKKGLPGGRNQPLEMPKATEELQENKFYMGQGKYAGQMFLFDGKEFLPVLGATNVLDEDLDEEAVAGGEAEEAEDMSAVYGGGEEEE